MELEKEIKTKVKVNKKIIYITNLQQLEDKINYKYNTNGILLDKNTHSKIPKVSNEEYKLISEYVSNYIFNELLVNCKLIPIYVPFSSNNYYHKDDSIQQCIVLASKDIEYNPKCLILIQGAGHVKLGEWSKSVCINEGLKLGSMIPFVEIAKNKGFSILILNPNERFGLDGKTKNIFNNMKEHCQYVYEKIINKNDKIKEIYFISHSLGGECNVEILKKFENDLLKGRIKKIAFTDSLHGGAFLDLSQDGIEIFKKISRNYVTSKEKKGTYLENLSQFYGYDVYSSGTNTHEYTTGESLENIFKYFESTH